MSKSDEILCLYIVINVLMVPVGWALPTICRAEPDLHFGSGSSGLGFLTRSQQSNHFRIVHLREELIELPHRIKHLRCVQTHHLIGIGSHLAQGIRGGATGTAHTNFCGCLARSTYNAAIIVESVASPQCVYHCRVPTNLRSTRFRNLVELNSVLFTITTEAIPFVG